MATLKVEIPDYYGHRAETMAFMTFEPLGETVCIAIPSKENPKLREKDIQVTLPLADLEGADFREPFLRGRYIALKLKRLENAGKIPVTNGNELHFHVSKKEADDAKALATDIRFSILDDTLDDMLEATDL